MCVLALSLPLSPSLSLSLSLSPCSLKCEGACLQTTVIFDHQREGKAARKRHQGRTRRLAHLVIRSTGKNQTFFLVKILLRFLKAVAPFFIAEIVERGPIPLIGKVCLRRWGKSAQVPEIIAEK